jgi:hypothetical protein
VFKTKCIVKSIAQTHLDGNVVFWPFRSHFRYSPSYEPVVPREIYCSCPKHTTNLLHLESCSVVCHRVCIFSASTKEKSELCIFKKKQDTPFSGRPSAHKLVRVDHLKGQPPFAFRPLRADVIAKRQRSCGFYLGEQQLQ